MRKRKLSKALLQPSEPALKGPVDRMSLAVALNYYSQYYDVKTSRKWLDEYVLNRFGTAFSKRFKAVPDKVITQTMCSMARLLSNGAKFNNNLDERIQKLVPKKISSEYTTIPVGKHQHAANNALITDIETKLDGFYRSGYRINFDGVSLDHSKKEIKDAVVYYTQLLDELNGIKKCDQLKEGYKFLSAASLKRYIDFVKTIVTSLNKSSVIKKTIDEKVKKARKPRRKKIKSPSQIVAKVKFKAVDPDLNIRSVSPEKLVLLAKTVWVYNTKSRKLIKYCSNPDHGPLSVKGTTITNFCDKKSFSKTIRKPKDIVPLIQTETGHAINTMVSNIRAKPQKVKGRLNSDTLILRVFK